MRTTAPRPLADTAPRTETWMDAGAAYVGTGRYREWGFGSSHTGVMNAVFGDGSVRSIRLSVDAPTLDRLGDREDGNVVNSSDL